MTRQGFLALLAGALLALLAPALSVAADPADPAPLLLRLPDLPPGYHVWTNTCEPQPLADDSSPRALRQLARQVPYKGCRIGFEWIWRGSAPSGDRFPASGAFAFADTSGASAALTQAQALAALVFDLNSAFLTPVAPAQAVGDETRMFHTSGPTGSAIVWRSGSMLAFVLATGHDDAATDQVALQLAAAQQERIAAPTPVRSADFDDAEVALDDPHLGVPVQWLGRHLPARRGDPALSLLDEPSLTTGRFRPRLLLPYGVRGGRSYVDISLWKPRTLRRGLRSDARRGICSRRFAGRIADVDATIYGLYEPPRRRCERGSPDTYFAIAFFDGVAVTLEAGCYNGCGARRAPYDSVPGLRTLLRALRVRETPRPAPAP